MARVAVVGTGVIGAGMAVNLLRNGHEVVVWNRTAEHAADVVANGATLAATPAEAAAEADVVFEATADDASSRSVWLGADGILAGSAAGSTLITSATLSPDWIAELADACSAAGTDVPRHPRHGRPCRRRGWNTDPARRRRSGRLWRRSATSSRRSRRGYATSGRSAAGRSSSSCSTPCKRFTSSASARRWRWLAPPDSTPPRSVRRSSSASVVQSRQMAWAADQELPARANFALSWALKDLRYASAMAGRPACADARRRRDPARRRSGKRAWATATGPSPTLAATRTDVGSSLAE